MPNFGYHLARLQGHITRRIYRAFLPLILRRPINSPRRIALEVFAYSGEAMLPEQIASIRSFLRHVGRPNSFTVVSDSSYSQRSVHLLELVDPVVTVRQANAAPSE